MMQKLLSHKILLLGIIGVLGIAALYGVVSQSVERASERVAPADSSTATLDARIEKLTQQIDENPDAVGGYVELARLYLEKIRETADGSYYVTVEDLLARAAELDPENPEILSAEAGLLASQHDFRGSREKITAALTLRPQTALYYGILGDALIELGEYDAAVDAFQKMVDFKPNFSSYSRVAYIRELFGDREGAREALRNAITAGSPLQENIAFAHTELGKLSIANDLTDAEKEFTLALQFAPEYAPALEGLGMVAFFRNEHDQALNFFMQAFDQRAIAQYAADIGNVYSSSGDTQQAEQYSTLAQIAFDQSRSFGTNVDFEEAAFLSDHNRDLPRALALAERAHAARSTSFSAATLAWTYYNMGKHALAKKYIDEALEGVGKYDALILYRAGVIYSAFGEQEKADAYFMQSHDSNPHFSLQFIIPQ